MKAGEMASSAAEANISKAGVMTVPTWPQPAAWLANATKLSSFSNGESGWHRQSTGQLMASRGLAAWLAAGV